MRTLAASLLVLIVSACSSAQPRNPATTGGSGGDEATGGSTGGSTGVSTGGSPGTGGGDATGGATGGSGVSPDAMVSIEPDSGAPDAPAMSTGDGGPLTIPGRPWIEPCDPSWTRAQCCMHYCACMMKNCASRLPAMCVETCSAPGNKWNLKCRVEQCFEAINPGNLKDQASHCGHAVEQPLKCQGIIP